MTEEWKQIKGYEGFYEVSNEGRVRSVKRSSTRGKVLKPIYDKDGYTRVCLCKHNIKKTFPVHRLVASAFLQKSDPTYNVINHKNEIKDDNRVSNLEWCDVRYNNNYNGMQAKRAAKRKKPLVAIKGDERIYFSCCKEAARLLNLSSGNLYGCLNKVYGRKSLKGYRFEYVESEVRNGK